MLLNCLWGWLLRNIVLKHRFNLKYKQKDLRFINLCGLLLSYVHSTIQFLNLYHEILAATPWDGQEYLFPLYRRKQWYTEVNSLCGRAEGRGLGRSLTVDTQLKPRCDSNPDIIGNALYDLWSFGPHSLFHLSPRQRSLSLRCVVVVSAGAGLPQSALLFILTSCRVLEWSPSVAKANVFGGAWELRLPVGMKVISYIIVRHHTDWREWQQRHL